MVYELYLKDIDGWYSKEEMKMKMKALESSDLIEEAKAEVEADAQTSRIGMRKSA